MAVTVREIRAAAQIIGRRNALRYLAIGMGASLLAACGPGKGGAATPPSGSQGTSGPSGSPTTGGASGATAAPTGSTGSTSPAGSGPATSGVAARAFDAFVKGDWNLESTTPNGKTVKGKATVMADGGGNGGFTLTWSADGSPVTWNGGWLLRGGHLRIDVYDAPGGVQRLTGGEALTVPKEAGEGLSLTFPWKAPGHRDANDGQVLKVTYRNNVLRIVHSENGHSESVHVCTRA
ncbi:hypothetical protein ABZ128_28750 [Streptomyces sp. NPDC006326]|uniref:hypothetical protein n=1 Tax=Streptomyces sp. NPDC006326 TaxID=3156752 RepID=UPI0033AB707B